VNTYSVVAGSPSTEIALTAIAYNGTLVDEFEIGSPSSSNEFTGCSINYYDTRITLAAVM
jgi:hypothetical protein